MSRCLGRLPHDPVAVAKAPRLRYSASVEAAVPSILDRSTVVYSPQMIGNDVYPNCTVVGLINAALAMEAIATNGAMAFDANAWMPFYAALAGCDPTPAAIAATDGLMLLDVLRKQGVSGFDIGAVAPLTGDFGMVPLDRVSLGACLAGLGCVYRHRLVSGGLGCGGGWQPVGRCCAVAERDYGGRPLRRAVGLHWPG